MSQINHQERIKKAIDDAQQAFWASFAASLPEIKTGDLDPLRAAAFEAACADAAFNWLDQNGDHQQDEPSISAAAEAASALGGLRGVSDKVLTVSTSHIPEHTAKALGQTPPDVEDAPLAKVLYYVMWGEYGWIIHCSLEHAHAIERHHPELAKLIEDCAKEGITYLQLDADGMVLDEYPAFDW